MITSFKEAAVLPRELQYLLSSDHAVPVIILVVLAFSGLSVMVVLGMSVFNFGNPAYYKYENGMYVVYKFIMYKDWGEYKAYRFRLDEDKLTYIKNKPIVPVYLMVIFTIIFIYGWVATKSFFAGVLDVFVVAVFLIWVFLPVEIYNVWYCKRFLRKELNL